MAPFNPSSGQEHPFTTLSPSCSTQTAGLLCVQTFVVGRSRRLEDLQRATILVLPVVKKCATAVVILWVGTLALFTILLLLLCVCIIKHVSVGHRFAIPLFATFTLGRFSRIFGLRVLLIPARLTTKTIWRLGECAIQILHLFVGANPTES